MGPPRFCELIMTPLTPLAANISTTPIAFDPTTTANLSPIPFFSSCWCFSTNGKDRKDTYMYTRRAPSLSPLPLAGQHEKKGVVSPTDSYEMRLFGLSLSKLHLSRHRVFVSQLAPSANNRKPYKCKSSGGVGSALLRASSVTSLPFDLWQRNQPPDASLQQKHNHIAKAPKRQLPRSAQWCLLLCTSVAPSSETS